MIQIKLIHLFIIILLALGVFWILGRAYLEGIKCEIQDEIKCPIAEILCRAYVFFAQIKGEIVEFHCIPCDQNSKAFNKDVCYFSAATENEYSSLCSNIRSQERKDTCYSTVAISKKDISLCKIAGSAEFFCYAGIAKKMKDFSICYMIAYNRSRDECLAEVGISTKDTSICAKIQTPYYGDWCYKSLAKSWLDFELCERITTTYGRGECYTFIAKAKKNISICDKIETWSSIGKYWNEVCYGDVQANPSNSS